MPLFNPVTPAAPVGRTVTATGVAATDTAALSAAITAAAPAGSPVFLTPSETTYSVNEPLVIGPLGSDSGTQPAPGLMSFAGAAHFGDYSGDQAASQIVAAAAFPSGSFLVDYQQTTGENSGGEGPGGGIIQGVALACASLAAGIRLQGPRGFTVRGVNVTHAASPSSPGDTSSGGFNVTALTENHTAGAYNHFEQVTVTDGGGDGFYSNGEFTDTYLNCHAFGNAAAQVHLDTNFQGEWIGGDVEGGNYGFLIETQVAATVSGAVMFQAPATLKNAVRINGGSPGSSLSPLSPGLLFTGCYFMNAPTSGTGEADGAVVYIHKDSTYVPRIRFIGCTFAAGTYTTDWVYTDSAITAAGAFVEFVNCTFLGSPITNQVNDQSGICTFTGCTGLAAGNTPVSGQYLCPPTQYAPSAETSLATASATLAAPTGAASTVAAGSNGGEVSAIGTWSSPSAGVLDVANGTLFPAGGGTVTVAASGPTTAVVTYTGVSGNSLTGCAYVSGSATGTVATGGAVTLTSSAVSTGNFTAPPSGTVMVTVTLIPNMGVTGNASFALAAHGSVSTLYGYAATPLVAQPNLTVYTLQFLVTGLTATDSYDFDLLFAASGGHTLTIYAVGQSTTTPTGTNGAPVVMTVQAV